LALAQHCETWGYRRFWVSEHHSHPSIVGTAPEILMAAIAARTQRIRIGSAGVMLPHYSALKVAEQFSMLEALFPGRIDLGIGRAPGGDMKTARALSGSTTGGSYNAAEHFPQQVMELVALLDGNLRPDHPHAEVVLQPQIDTAPQVWILGSSDYGGALAAHLGLRFAFAHFINPHGGEHVAHAYRADFKAAPGAATTRGAVTPTAWHAIALFCICGLSPNGV
jgi:luciferase family oxidoreductase group 1